MMSDSKIGGYPVEWFAKTPSQSFKCGICLDVLKNPHQCKNGHNFCLSCISQALEAHRECPTCKTALKISTLCVNLPLREIIDELLVVKCNHHDNECEEFEGCEWSGPLEQSFDHFKTCPNHIISCPLHKVQFCMHGDCCGKIKRQDLRDHLFGTGSKRDVADTMLIMAETIACQKKENEFLKKLCLNKEAKHRTFQDGSEFFGIYEKNDVVKDLGILQFPDGSSHVGEFKNGAYHGFGVHRAGDEVFAGEWSNNKQNGHGMYWFTSPKNSAFTNTYIGDFNGGKKHGVGIFVGISDTDAGCYENDDFHGQGTRTFSNDHVFEGTFDDVPSKTIPGILKCGNITLFEGTINDDGSFIKGKFTCDKSKAVYEGTFSENANQLNVTGTGAITYALGTVYTGEFRKGCRHGSGTCIFPNKDILKATFNCYDNHPIIEVTGTLTMHNGSTHVGKMNLAAWLNRCDFCKGVFTAADGTVYEGEFEDNKGGTDVDGTGTITYTDGTVYTGEFRNGQKYGENDDSVSNIVVSTTDDNNINTCTDDVSMGGAAVGGCVDESM